MNRHLSPPLWANAINLRVLAAVCFLATLLSYLTLLLALRAVDFDLAAMSTPANQVGVGQTGAVLMKWSMLCDAFGFYILSLPAAVYLWYRLQEQNPFLIAAALGIPVADTGRPAVIQERAYTSPIWYNP